MCYNGRSRPILYLSVWLGALSCSLHGARLYFVKVLCYVASPSRGAHSSMMIT